MTRFDVVIYGATGFTGAHIVEYLISSEKFEGVSFAVAGRSEKKLRQVLESVSEKTGKDVKNAPVIIADTSDENSLAEMAKQAKVVINAVGPYHLHGEAVIKAAIENGASHLDISGEETWMENMQLKYNDLAAKNGVYVVSACGFDSIPADLGVNFLKKNFRGDLNHVESFVQIHFGPSGYAFNAGTYQTAILELHAADKSGAVKKQLMPETIAREDTQLPKRGNLSGIHEKELDGVAVPFLGADKSIVNRSQYYEATEKHRRPVHIETYVRLPSMFYGVLFNIIVVIFTLMVKVSVIRKILQRYPDQCSAYMFKNSGPTKQQIKEASFTYWLFGYGYREQLPVEQQHQGKPDKKVVAYCKGPDLGYIATSGFVLSSALTIIRDSANLPKKGGVYTTAAAFGDSSTIYEYLSSFGITYQVVSQLNLF